MSGSTPTEEGDRSPSLGGRVEAMCDRFEAAWKAGRRPAIEDYLGAVSESGQTALFRELLVLDLNYRDRVGDRSTPEDYSGRFPEHAELIAAVFSDQIITRREGSVESPDVTPVRPAGDATSASPRYQIRESHARGGLGEVFKAHDQELRRVVALKRMQAGHADSPESRARFVREAEITGRLEHPGIVPVYGLCRDPDGRPYYAMRFIEGKTFKEAIQQFHKAESPGREPGGRILALRKLLRHFLDACDAVGFAHSRGVLHRDLKPANIMLGPYGETLVVDWGLAKPVGRPEEASHTEEETLRPDSDGLGNVTRPGDTPGTPAYMSPEQAAGDLDRLGLPSDVYSLGATLYSLLTGKPPFEGRDLAVVLENVRKGEFPRPRQVNRNIDPALEAICLKAMALRPEDRYTTPGALAEDLHRWLADEPIVAWREPWSVRARRWTRRHGHQVAISFLLLLLLAVVVAAAGWTLNERKNAEIATRKADHEATLATHEAASQQYHAILNRIRANRGRVGWTQTGLDDIRRAAELDTTSRDPSELRNEAADCLMAVDVRRSTVLGERFDVGRLAFSPDGKVIALAEKEANSLLFFGRVRVIDMENLTEIKLLKYKELYNIAGISRPEGRERVLSLAFSPDGRRLALGMRLGRVWLWEWDQPDPPPVVWARIGNSPKLSSSTGMARRCGPAREMPL